MEAVPRMLWRAVVLLACTCALVECVSMAQRKQEAMKTVMDCTREIKKMVKPKDMKDIKAKRCPRSQDAKCLVGCTLTKMKMLKKDHSFDTEIMTEFIMKTDGLKDKQKLIEAMEDCAKKMGKQKSECDAGSNGCTCMLNSGVLATML